VTSINLDDVMDFDFDFSPQVDEPILKSEDSSKSIIENKEGDQNVKESKLESPKQLSFDFDDDDDLFDLDFSLTETKIETKPIEKIEEKLEEKEKTSEKEETMQIDFGADLDDFDFSFGEVEETKTNEKNQKNEEKQHVTIELDKNYIDPDNTFATTLVPIATIKDIQEMFESISTVEKVMLTPQMLLNCLRSFKRHKERMPFRLTYFLYGENESMDYSGQINEQLVFEHYRDLEYRDIVSEIDYKPHVNNNCFCKLHNVKISERKYKTCNLFAYHGRSTIISPYYFNNLLDSFEYYEDLMNVIDLQVLNDVFSPIYYKQKDQMLDFLKKESESYFNLLNKPIEQENINVTMAQTSETLKEDVFWESEINILESLQLYNPSKITTDLTTVNNQVIDKTLKIPYTINVLKNIIKESPINMLIHFILGQLQFKRLNQFTKLQIIDELTSMFNSLKSRNINNNLTKYLPILLTTWKRRIFSRSKIEHLYRDIYHHMVDENLVILKKTNLSTSLFETLTDQLSDIDNVHIEVVSNESVDVYTPCNENIIQESKNFVQEELARQLPNHSPLRRILDDKVKARSYNNLLFSIS